MAPAAVTNGVVDDGTTVTAVVVVGLWDCQEKTQGGSDDKRKGGKQMKMSGKARCKVRYKRVSTDLYRRDEPDRDVYIWKR